MSPEQAFGEVVREARKAIELSQEELGFACERHPTYISLIERGRNSVSLRTLWVLAKALKLSPSELLARVEKRVRRG